MGTKDGKHNNSEASALFRSAVGDAEPLKTRARHQSKPAAQPAARARRRAEQHNPDDLTPPPQETALVEAGERLFYQQGSVNRTTIKNLRRGNMKPAAQIDLHGLTSAEAHAELREFVAECQHEGLRCIRVVHGKGLTSGSRGPVLKNGVNNWLRLWDNVLAFCSAPDNDGGTGAAYVLLKKG